MQNPPPGAGQKTSMGLDANVAALLSYVLTWVTGLVFYLIEKENRYVRYHAMQAILFGAAWFIIAIIFTFISFTLAMMDISILSLLFWPIRILFWFGFLAAWIFSMIKAYQGQMFKLPIIGKMAENMVNK